MRHKNIIILISIIAVCTLTACSKSQNISIANQKFEKDENTLTKEEANSLWINNIDTNDEVIEEYSRTDNGISAAVVDNTIGELQLVGNDNSIEWTVKNNSDVEYLGRTYYGLYSSVYSVEMPFDKNNFINFILKTYRTQQNEVFVGLNIDSDSDDYIMTVADDASGLIGYQTLVDKYGTDVYWSIEVYERGYNNSATIYGCKEYLAYKGNSDTITVDMSIYDSGIVNEIQYEATETPEENVDNEDIDIEYVEEQVENNDEQESIEENR